MILFALLLALPEAVGAGGGATKWGAIVVHKSGDAAGSAESIDAFQREKLRDPDGIDHHFVIGNGNGAPDGDIAVTAPWTEGRKTSHLFRAARTLPPAISVMLVGAHRDAPTEAQRAALAELIAALAARYEIPATSIHSHREVESGTECPGTLDKVSLFAAAGLLPEGPRRLRVSEKGLQASLLQGEALLMRSKITKRQTQALPRGAFKVCRRDQVSAFGPTLVLAWPTNADVDAARQAGRITDAEATRMRDALKRGECPPDDTALGGELAIHAGPGEDATCIELEAADMRIVYDALEVGSEVEIE